MIYAILMLASLSSAQDISTSTYAIPVDTQIEISNLGKDTKELLSGRYTQTGKPKFKNGFCFGDSTCQTTAPVFTVFASSQTHIADVTGTNTAFLVAAATVTMTTFGGPVWCSLAGTVYNTLDGQNIYANILVDNSYVTIGAITYTAAITGGIAMASAQAPGNSYATGMPPFPLIPLAAGSHTFAIQFAASGNTWGLDKNFGAAAQFACTEMGQ